MWIDLALATLVLIGLASAGCSNHFILHPRAVPESVITWKEKAVAGDLEMRLVWAAPASPGPHPGVLVHPEARHTAREMRGIAQALAQQGYVALAVDYRHLPTGDRLFTWTRAEDARAALDRLTSHPEVDASRVGALGYSQGGVYSLVIAAQTQAVRAVVAYYPVTDFGLWFDDPSRPFVRRQLFRVIETVSERRLEKVEAAAGKSFEEIASPLEQVDHLVAPVLLVHGDADTTVTLEHSIRLERALAERGREVRLVRVPGAEHVFNFRRRDLAALSWQETLAWFHQHLASP